ncbi:MAG TPA: hypothetical protein VHZ78_15980 [Rhizomicrobium sp.]|jgi:hypothetical protein|nr:hypothetical protein [Rhizomicrobium sp.]
MDFKEIQERVEREMDEEEELRAAQRAAYQAKRKLFLEALLGGSDPLTWQMPPEIDDYDALLAQHAAQLRNAVRYMMGEALDDDRSPERRNMAAGTLTRMIQANIAIAKTALSAKPRGKSKTGHGGESAQEAQD